MNMIVELLGMIVNIHLQFCLFIIYLYIYLQVGWTALMGAAENGHYEIADLLVKSQADVIAKDKVSAYTSE